MWARQFTSDPFIEECKELNTYAIDYAINQGVPCKMLTKRADIYIPTGWYNFKHLLAFGFTLTGMDSMELHASTNAERIECMRKLYKAGFRTFASIEPIIDLESSYEMIKQTLGFCDLYKIGLISGKRNYTREEVEEFVKNVNVMIIVANHGNKVYWKDSVLEYIKHTRDELVGKIFVNADYNMFNN